MSVELAIRGLIGQGADVTALLGSGEDVRCWHMYAPQNAAVPYVVTSLEGGEELPHQKGVSLLERADLTLRAVGKDPGEAAAVMTAIRRFINRRQNVKVGPTWLRLISCELPSDDGLIEDDGQEGPRPVRRMAIAVWYRST